MEKLLPLTIFVIVLLNSSIVFSSNTTVNSSSLIYVSSNVYVYSNYSSSVHLDNPPYDTVSFSSDMNITELQSNITQYYAVLTIYEPFEYYVDVQENSVETSRGFCEYIHVNVSTTSQYNKTNVTLVAYGLPSNISISFDPNGLVPDYSSIGEICVGDSAPYGDYTITVSGVSGNQSVNDTFTLSIREFNIFVDVYPDSKSVYKGSDAIFGVSVTHTGATVSVHLNVSGIPPNSTYDLGQTTIIPDGTTTLRIHTHDDTPVGNYTITVCGYAGLIQKCDSATLEVKEHKMPEIMHLLSSEVFVAMLILGSVGMYVSSVAPEIGYSISTLSLVITAIKYPNLMAIMIILMAMLIVYAIRKLLFG